VWPTTADFYKEFLAKAKSDPDYVHASCAAAVVVLQDAIERAGSSDKKKVRDALAATNVDTFYGPVKFSPNGMNEVRDLPIIQVQDKHIKVLHPADIKDGDMMLMK
jgi:branched-chain amino acid transport system substrate-binding protein